MPGKANEQQQRQWLAEYGKLKQNLPENETICFMDGVHPTHNVQPAYGWIKKGERKEIPANSGRARLNLSGANAVLPAEAPQDSVAETMENLLSAIRTC